MVKERGREREREEGERERERGGERERERERDIESERGQCFDLKMNNTFSLMEGRKNEIPAKKRQDVTTTAPTTATTISRFNS